MKPITAKALGKRLRRLLDATGMTQMELAIKIGSSDPTINHYLQGRSLPTLPVLQRLAAALNTTVGEIIGETTSTPTSTT